MLFIVSIFPNLSNLCLCDLFSVFNSGLYRKSISSSRDIDLFPGKSWHCLETEKDFKCLEIPISETFKWSNMKFHISVAEDLMNLNFEIKPMFY